MTPSIGRVVHYVSYGTPGGEYGKECRAAIITQVSSDAYPADVGLCVLNPTGQFFNPHVHQDDGEVAVNRAARLCDGLEHTGGTWHWPARVDS